MSDTATEVAASTSTSTEGGDATGTLLTGEVDAGAATDTTENPYSGIINPDGTFIDSWQEKLAGDDYADTRATAANYKDLPGLLKGLKDSKSAAMQRLDGMIKMPGDESTPEEVAAYRAAIGVPEDVSGYELNLEGLPEGAEIDEATFEEFKDLALAQNLTPAQVNELARFQLGIQAKGEAEYLQAQEDHIAEQRTELETEWGPKFQEKFMLAQRTAATVGLDAENPIFQNADAVKAFAQIGAMISEDRLVSGEQVANRLSPESQADDIISNEANALNKAYHDPDNHEHKAAVAEVERLMKKAYPG